MTSEPEGDWCGDGTLEDSVPDGWSDEAKELIVTFAMANIGVTSEMEKPRELPPGLSVTDASALEDWIRSTLAAGPESPNATAALACIRLLYG